MRNVDSATVHRRQLELPREICPVSLRRLHIALIDCTYDWEAKDRDYGPGTESNRRCFVAVVAPSGRFQLVSLAGVSSDSLLRARLEWTNPDQLEFSADGVVKNIEMK